MAQLGALIVTQDKDFERQIARLLHAGGVPVGILNTPTIDPDFAVVDIRHDTESALAAIERLRTSVSSVAIFAVASANDPALILQAMRAGANEFFAAPADGWGTPAARSTEEAFHGAVRRAQARLESTHQDGRRPSTVLMFFGAKGGAGTTTVSVNCAVELARLTKRPTVIVDLKSCLGEVALFLGVRPQFTVVDAVENLHRLDRDFLTDLVVAHKSGVHILAGSEQFDRPGVQDTGAVEELFRILPRTYEFIVVDGGNLINSCAVAALYAADRIYLVINPDVPSIRNAQRLIERVRQLGAGSERVRILVNRFAEHLMIQPIQIERALGHEIDQVFQSDYQTVSTSLNSGVPLTLTNNSGIASQFQRFTKGIIAPPTPEPAAPPAKKRGILGLLPLREAGVAP